MKSRLSILALTLALLLVSCAPVTATPTPAPIVTEEKPIFGMAVVQSVEVQITENSPIQVNAIVRGQLPDAGCTTISSVNQAREGNTFRLTLITTTDPLALCALALTPFEQVVALDVGNLTPAKYVVNANGVEAGFELLTRDHGQFEQMLVDALNVRNYDLLETLMDESLMIAYWRSEGVSQTPDQAIEQLRMNLLNSSSPITADHSRNLVELLGADPVTIVGPDVIEASPLFVSGLGAEGRDEAILFVAKLPDGGLYWYGLLFAKDGFAANGSIVNEPVVTNPPPVNPPVRTDPQPTSVKYILAKQDVSIRSGPGTQYSVIGSVASGQIAKVTGVSADGNWWRVICPDDTVGSCWVSANSSDTQPTQSP